MRTKKLSVVQWAMLMRLAEFGSEESPCRMGKDSARAASAWHRTAESLVKRGLVARERKGDHYAASLTPAGRGYMHQHGAL